MTWIVFLLVGVSLLTGLHVQICIFSVSGKKGWLSIFIEFFFFMSTFGGSVLLWAFSRDFFSAKEAIHYFGLYEFLALITTIIATTFSFLQQSALERMLFRSFEGRGCKGCLDCFRKRLNFLLDRTYAVPC